MSRLPKLSLILLVCISANAYSQTSSLTVSGSPGGTDGLTALRTSRLNGFAAGDYFATSAAIAGDLNGDGFADIIVGAPMNDAVGADAGRAYVFFGGPLMTTTPNLILTGGTAGDVFGFSVAGAGDVNADGYADVIVGAPFNDAGGTNSGAAYVYFGGPAMNSSPDVLLSGEAAGDEFGRSVASAGDFNGDGYDDVIVGAWRADVSGSDNGKAYLFHGGLLPEGNADRSFTGSNPGDLFGVSVAGVGDMDNNGYDEVAIGAEGATGGVPISGPGAGKVVIHFGDGGGTFHRQLTIVGVTPYDYFGHSVAGAGDVNGDGYADLIVGAYGNDVAGTDAGRALIYHGGQFVDVNVDLVLYGKTPGEYAGISVASVGDMNGDGYSDVIVGAHLNDVGALNGGAARVYCGGALMDAIPDTWLTGSEAGEVLGLCVAGGGDVDGDGYDDYCAGAYRNDAHGVDAGRLYLCFNALTGADQPDLAFYGLAQERFGDKIRGIGDVNGDSYDDFAATAFTNRYTAGSLITVFVYYGGAVLDTVPDAILYGDTQMFANGIAGGDLNGDGLSDLAIGAVNAGTGGRVYIYLSKPGFTNVPDQILEGSDAGEFFGCSVASGGDVNGDGYDDLAIGSDHYSGFRGSISIALGGQNGPGTWQRLNEGMYGGDRLGTTVAMGDFNRDGYADICAAASREDTLSPGYLRVTFGGWGNLVHTSIWDTPPGERFGEELSSPGDVNGDGYDDILAKRYSQEDGWAIYLYAGGITLATTPELVVRRANTGVFDVSLAGTGDMNGDGFADVAIGVGWGADIYFGGRSPDAVPDILLRSDEIQEYPGPKIDFVGDVNGDGIDDALLGAPLLSVPNRGFDGGAAYLFLSSSPAIVPRIFSAADVPADQGGRILLSWTRSGYDALGVSRVTSYTIERSLPPGKTGFAWEPIGTIHAAHNPRYAFAASTLNDSSANASGTLFFRITAATDNPNEYWRSIPVSAHSVDNLAPSAPASLAGTVAGESAFLHWHASAAADLSGYELFRSTSAGFDPDTLQPIATLADTAFTDTPLPADPTLYYVVRAIDVHGNRSGPSNELRLGPVGVADERPSLPVTFVLEQNYPNPFNPTTVIRYGVPERSEISLLLFNVLGEEIAVLVRGVVEAGYHEVRLNAAHLPSGIYFCTMRGGGIATTRKVALVR